MLCDIPYFGVLDKFYTIMYHIPHNLRQVLLNMSTQVDTQCCIAKLLSKDTLNSGRKYKKQHPHFILYYSLSDSEKSASLQHVLSTTAAALLLAVFWTVQSFFSTFGKHIQHDVVKLQLPLDDFYNHDNSFI